MDRTREQLVAALADAQRRIDELEAAAEAAPLAAGEQGLSATLVEVLPYPTMLVKRDRTILFANRAAREQGARVGGVCWRDFAGSQYIPEAARERLERTGEPPPGPVSCTFCRADACLDAGGAEVAPEVNAFDRFWKIYWVPLGGGDTFLHFALDVTEARQAAERGLQDERRQLKAQKMESLGVLAGGIAHDFNNLLMAILGNAELAMRRMPVTEPVHDHLRRIEKASHRAADLARQMLAFSGHGRYASEMVDLGAVVRSLPRVLDAGGGGVVLDRRTGGDLPRVAGDPAQIRQAVFSLLTNASEALGDGPGEVEVSVGVAECDRAMMDGAVAFAGDAEGRPLPPGEYAWVEVADSGPGVPEGEREKIFEPFYSTRFTGRGLGLSATLGIMKGHRGFITLAGAEGVGARFRLYFPVAEEAAPAAAPAAPARVVVGWKGSGTILVADDEEGVLRVASGLLRGLGFHVVTAPDGREAVELFGRHRTALVAVILDLTMPGLDGEQACRRIREQDAAIPIILCSGYDSATATRRFADLGLSGFLQKPYQRSELAVLLQKFLPRQ